MNNQLINQINQSKNVRYIFCDYYDTVVHRTVHPNYVIRLWAKIMIRELGLDSSIDDLYFIRKESEQFLMQKFKKHYVEIPYETQIEEVYNRLVCTNRINQLDKTKFTAYFKEAEFKSESLVQYPNHSVLDALKELRGKGYKIYCVSDFYTSGELLKKLIHHHGFGNIYEDIFVSSDCEQSKHSGGLFSFLTKKLEVKPEEVVMVGDNKKSDFINAKKAELQAIHLVEQKEIKKRERRIFGNDKRDYRKTLNDLYKKCNSKTGVPNSDYILFYAVYIERLYAKAKRDGIKNLFFLSREGLFLQKLFDHYQDHTGLFEEDSIKSHYLKCSRQASILVGLEELHEEDFKFFRKKYPHLSVYAFLKNFNLTDDIIDSIIQDAKIEVDKNFIVKNFLDSQIFEQLKSGKLFAKHYNEVRIFQKSTFKTYLNSFGVDFASEGVHVCDVGWGGTIQEYLYSYFGGKVKVYGYYLGIREVYDIKEDTKRFGLNFRAYPYPEYSDYILMANYELNEQLLSASHGSIICYTTEDKGYTLEKHDPVEKEVFQKYIAEIQDFMLGQFTEVLNQWDSICYGDSIVQQEMTRYALKSGLFASKKKTESSTKIYEGFFTNVGNFERGLRLGSSISTGKKFSYIRSFFVSPEKVFRVMLRIKPLSYLKKKYYRVYFLPTGLIYVYYKIHHFIKTKVVSKFFYLRYSNLK